MNCPPSDPTASADAGISGLFNAALRHNFEEMRATDWSKLSPSSDEQRRLYRLAGEQILSLEGLGKIKALGLSSQTADVDLEGVAAAHVNVSGELKASLDGVSKLKYKGAPDKTHIRKDGLSGVSELDQ